MAPAPDALPQDASLEDLVQAYLTVHAQGAPMAAALFARGEELRRRAGPDPAIPAWGRFLVAQGELAAESLADPAGASTWFLAALTWGARHDDHEVAVTAGYNQGVLLERTRRIPQARQAYTVAATQAMGLGLTAPIAIRVVLALVRLEHDPASSLTPATAALLKSAWLLWLWLRRDPGAVAADLEADAQAVLAAFLLPEDPALLAVRWRSWPPSSLAAVGVWPDHDPACLRMLYAVAADAADAPGSGLVGLGLAAAWRRCADTLAASTGIV